jgi:hypothetical protein
VIKKAKKDVAEAKLQRHRNYSTKDRAVLEAAFDEGVTKIALEAIKSTEVGGKELGCDVVRNDQLTLVVGALATVKL